MARLGRAMPNRPLIVHSRTFDAPPAGTPATWKAGPPEAKWSAGPPEIKWAAESPEVKWRAGPPERG
jgi:hypothetical protein